MIQCAVKGSSHLKTFDSGKSRPTLGFSSIHSYSGLSVMDSHFDRCSLRKIEKPKSKLIQLDQFCRDIQSEEAQTVALCALSNDYKSFLTLPKSFLVQEIPVGVSLQDLKIYFGVFGKLSSVNIKPLKSAVLVYEFIENQSLSNLSRDFVIKGNKLKISEQERYMMTIGDSFSNDWKSWSSQEKASFSVLKSRRLHKHYIKHLVHQLNIYKSILTKIFKNSSVKNIVHMSVLERVNKNYPQLEMLFFILNSALRDFLYLWNKNGDIKNKFGVSIKFAFSDAQHIFWQAPFKGDIFINKEWKGSVECTHRKHEVIERSLLVLRDTLKNI